MSNFSHCVRSRVEGLGTQLENNNNALIITRRIVEKKCQKNK